MKLPANVKQFGQHRNRPNLIQLCQKMFHAQEGGWGDKARCEVVDPFMGPGLVIRRVTHHIMAAIQ